MTIHAAANTIAGQVHERALNLARDISMTPMTVVAEQFERYQKAFLSEKTVNPQHEAMRFYALEHAVGMIRERCGAHEPLEDGTLALLQKYNREGLEMAARAYYYLLLICWRESRYCRNKTVAFSNGGKSVGADGGSMLGFLNLANDTNNFSQIAENWGKAGAITVGQLAGAMAHAYRRGSWPGMYGGPKWAAVTDCLVSFVKGETSAAMMLDTVWTLAHNTAPIFNKGMLYSAQDASALKEVLDVQRSGQVPQYILTCEARGYEGKGHVSKKLVRDVQTMGAVCGVPFTGGIEVDWQVVEDLGALNTYGGYKAALKAAGIAQSVSASTASKAATKAGVAKDIVAEAMKPAPPPASVTKTVVPGLKVEVMAGRGKGAA